MPQNTEFCYHLEKKNSQNDLHEQRRTQVSNSSQMSVVLNLNPSVSTSKIAIKASRTRIIKVMHMFMIIWGVLVLVLHTRVTVRSRSQFCVHGLRPWFSFKTGCTTMKLNCNAFTRMKGDLADLTDSSDGLDEQFLTKIDIVNCPNVEIPSSIQHFFQLEGMLIFNSTRVRWDAESALTDKTHPKMSDFGANGINLTDVLLRLRSLDFPKLVQE